MTNGKLEENRLVLDLSDKEIEELELDTNKGFEIFKAKKGVWVLLECEPKKTAPAIDEAEQKIIGLLLKKELKSRVEGAFEKLLSESEQAALKKMLEENKVEKFKLNEKYRKAIYRLPEKQKPASKTFEPKEKKPDDYTLEDDGFMIAKTEFVAQQISSRLAEKIKNGEFRGTRAFSGEFYIIDSGLFEQKTKPVTDFLKIKKHATIEELNASLALPKTLIKIICAFLTEDGIILERRKEQYVYID